MLLDNMVLRSRLAFKKLTTLFTLKRSGFSNFVLYLLKLVLKKEFQVCVKTNIFDNVVITIPRVYKFVLLLYDYNQVALLHKRLNCGLNSNMPFASIATQKNNNMMCGMS
ncbi:MAG: hypothetical protein RLZZ387_3412 [Chloroflexota bacterium]